MPEEPAPLGIHRGELRRAGWRRLSRGLYVRGGDSLTDLAALAAVLPRDSGLGHLSSAAVRGWWLPLGRPPGVVLATTRSRVHVQRHGMYVRRSDYADVEVVDGVPLMTAAQTLLELARDLALIDLVPMVDCALRGGATPDELLAACRPKAYGAGKLKRAVQLADRRSESWWESMLRLQHVLTGLGPVEPQAEVWDGALFVCRADLHLVGTRRYPECDGSDHRDKARQAKDLARARRMSRLGLERYGYTPDEIARRPEQILRDAEDARGLPIDPVRARRWWAFARASTLTAHGRTRLAARLARYRRAGEPLLAGSGSSDRRGAAASRQQSGRGGGSAGAGAA